MNHSLDELETDTPELGSEEHDGSFAEHPLFDVDEKKRKRRRSELVPSKNKKPKPQKTIDECKAIFLTLTNNIRARTGKSRLKMLEVGGGIGRAFLEAKTPDPDLKTYNLTIHEDPGAGECMPAEWFEQMDLIVSNADFPFHDAALKNVLKALSVGGEAHMFFPSKAAPSTDEGKGQKMIRMKRACELLEEMEKTAKVQLKIKICSSVAPLHEVGSDWYRETNVNPHEHGMALRITKLAALDSDSFKISGTTMKMKEIIDAVAALKKTACGLWPGDLEKKICSVVIGRTTSGASRDSIFWATEERKELLDLARREPLVRIVLNKILQEDQYYSRQRAIIRSQLRQTTNAHAMAVLKSMAEDPYVDPLVIEIFKEEVTPSTPVVPPKEEENSVMYHKARLRHAM